MRLIEKRNEGKGCLGGWCNFQTDGEEESNKGVKLLNNNLHTSKHL